jgi:sulfur carrier protein
MEILINNEAFNTQAKSLYDLLTEHGLNDQKGIAVAVNNTVVPKTNWTIHLLINQDKVTVIKATQGG